MRFLKSTVPFFLIAAILIFAIPFHTAAATELQTADKAGYTDVKGLWCETWVSNYGYREIFAGEGERFYPDQSITRMEFARLLHVALDINMNYFAATNISEYYSDVNKDDTGASALYDLVTCGIIDEKGSFRPNDILDRDAMIHYVMNAFKYIAGGNYQLPTVDRTPFSDIGDIKFEYANDIDTAQTLELVKGKGDNSLYPREAATRAEAVTIVGRLAELLEKYQSAVSVKASAEEKDGGLYLSLSIANNADKSVTITHASQQLYDFVVFNKDGKELYRWSADRVFAMYVTYTGIPANKSVVFTELIEADAYSKIKASAFTVKAYLTGTSEDFLINSAGYDTETTK